MWEVITTKSKKVSVNDYDGMRAFLALDVKDKKTIKLIEDVQKKLIETGADLKPVEPNNLHLTLKFFGEINDALAMKIKNSLENVKFKPLHVIYKGMGVFPSPKRISVIWVGVDKNCVDDLFNITNKVEERLRGITPIDERGFQPHLTISRVKSGRNKDKLLAFIKEHENQDFGEEIITSMKLKKSDLTPRGPIYSDVYIFPFEME
ncbi:MAG: RNA 2',3'-cyclic phosphodiesterase [Nitrososphaerales archaeon]